jgi:hypothetical protein
VGQRARAAASGSVAPSCLELRPQGRVLKGPLETWPLVFGKNLMGWVMDSEMREAFSERFGNEMVVFRNVSETAPYFPKDSETRGWFSETIPKWHLIFRKIRKIIKRMIHNGPWIPLSREKKFVF